MTPRDWKYMRTTLDRVLDIWVKFPDLRLGQLLSHAINVSYTRSAAPNTDIFYIQDNVLTEVLEKLADEYDQKNHSPS